MIRMLGPAPSRVVRIAKLRAMFAQIGRSTGRATKIKSRIRHTKRLFNPLPFIQRMDRAHMVRSVKHGAATRMAQRIVARRNRMMVEQGGKIPKSISSIKVSVKPVSQRYFRAGKKALGNTLVKVAVPAGVAYLGAATVGSYKYGKHVGLQPEHRKKKVPPIKVGLIGGLIGDAGFYAGQKESRRLYKVRRSKKR